MRGERTRILSPRLEGRAIIVTGAASGMGAACARAVAAEGGNVLLVDVNADSLEDVVADLGPRAAYASADVSEPGASEALVRECIDRFGEIDGLVNAAGVMQTKPILDIEAPDFDRLFAVNVRGSFFLMQAAGREMVGRRGGSIVNFSSTAGRGLRPLAAHYAATKAAVVSFTKSAAAALAADGVRVNCVCPGLIETPMIQKIRKERVELLGGSEDDVTKHWVNVIPARRLGTPEEVASIVMFLLSDEASYVTGEAIGATGGSDGS